MPPLEQHPLDESLPDEVKDFITSEIVVGDMALPSSYPKLHELEAWQVGFRSHGLTDESLVSTRPGAWQPGWYVIALNGFDDPFFIDIAQKAAGFPIYYAPHGAGRWDVTIVAPCIQHFSQILLALRKMEGDDAQALQFIETETDATNTLWREVCEARRDREATEREPTQPDTDYDPKDLEQGTLVIIDVGPHKLKVVQILRRALDVSLHEALTLAEERNIVVSSGPLVRLRRIQDRLTALGALTEFRSNAKPAV